MKADEFVAFLSSTKPAREELERGEASEDYIDFLMDINMAQKVGHESFENPIVELVTNWRFHTMSVFDFTFNNQIVENGQYLIFGRDNNGLLGYDKVTGKISALEDDTYEVTSHCADSAEKFLDALVDIQLYWTYRMTHCVDEAELIERAIKVANLATLKAGGEDYEEYYWTQLPYLWELV